MSQRSARTPVAVDGKEVTKEKEISKTPTKKKSTAIQSEPHQPTVKIQMMESQSDKKDTVKDVPQENNKTKTNGTDTQNGDFPTISNGKADTPKTNGKVDTSNINGSTENGLPNSGVKEAVDTVDEEEVVVEQENDEMFPELRYEEASDNEGNFESSTPDHAAVGRSTTRRSQVKPTRTPETPKPIDNGKSTVPQSETISEEKEPQVASAEAPAEQKETPHIADSTVKVLKLKEGPISSSAMKLRSSDSPVKQLVDASKGEKKDGNEEELKNEQEKKGNDGAQSKSDTNFSKSRIKVSPYRRSMRKSEQHSTVSATSTSETELSEPSTSQMEDRPSANDDSLGQDRSPTDFRHIKGRRSYKKLREISLRNLSMQRQRRENMPDREDMEMSIVDSVNATTGSDIASLSTLEGSTADAAPKSRYTPIGTVIGRKRRPSPSPDRRNLTVEEYLESFNVEPAPAAKRTRFFDRVSERMSAGVTPIRRLLRRGYSVTSSTPVEVTFPEEYRDVAEAEYMSIVPPSEPPAADEPSPIEPIADKAEVIVPAVAVQPNRRCAIM